MEAADDGGLPDDLRCRRNDGKYWRCSQRVVDGLSHCKLHQDRARHRAKKENVPDSLKLQRKPRRSRKVAPDPQPLEGIDRHAEEAEIKAEADGEGEEAAEKRSKGGLLVEEGLLIELVRLVIRRKKRQPRKHPTRLVLPKREEDIVGTSSSDLLDGEENTAKPTLSLPEGEEIKGMPLSSFTEGDENKGIPSSSLPEGEENKGMPSSSFPEGQENKGMPSINFTEGEENKGKLSLSLPEGEENTGKTWSSLHEGEEDTGKPLSSLSDEEEDTSKSSSSLPEKKGDTDQSPSVSQDVEDNTGQSSVVTSLECDSLEPSKTIPNHLRCQRTDGKQWRCRRAAAEGKNFCAHHLELFVRQQHKHKVPGRVKNKRRRQPARSQTLSENNGTLRTRSQTKKKNNKQPEKDGRLRKRKRGNEKEINNEEGNNQNSQKKRKGRLAGLLSMAVRQKYKKRKGSSTLAAKDTRTSQRDRAMSKHPKDQNEVVPDHLRCKRSDGKFWRCKRRALDNLSFCELHHVQAIRRQNKLGVPDSMKLKRKPRGPAQIDGDQPQTRKKRMTEEETKRAKKIEKTRKKNESLLVDVMSLVLQRQLSKREESERKKRLEASVMGDGTELTRDLPNGLMSIAPIDPASANDAVTHLDRKIGLDSTSFLRWCFRSKNTDPSPVGPLKMLPHIRKAVGLKKRRKRNCHRCHNHFLGRIVISCSRCRKVSICRSCLKKWYIELSESDIRVACPPCRGKCSCAACISRRTIKR